jgi:hypothetical protein
MTGTLSIKDFSNLSGHQKQHDFGMAIMRMEYNSEQIIS